MNINSLPRAVFGHLCTFIDAKSRSNLNLTCKKCSEWEKDFPFWELMQDVQFVEAELLKPIHFSKKFSEICEFQKNPSISSCATLYQNIMTTNKALEIIKIKPIDIGCLLEKAKDLIAKNKRDIKSGNLKIEETLLVDFFVLYAEVHISKFCNRKAKVLVGYQLNAFRKAKQIMSIYKNHYNASYTKNCEIFLEKLSATGQEYHLSIAFKLN